MTLQPRGLLRPRDYSTTRVSMTTKRGQMVAHHDGLLPIKSYDPLIT